MPKIEIVSPRILICTIISNDDRMKIIVFLQKVTPYVLSFITCPTLASWCSRIELNGVLPFQQRKKRPCYLCTATTKMMCLKEGTEN